MINYAALKTLFGAKLPPAYLFFATYGARKIVPGYKALRKEFRMPSATNLKVWKKFVAEYNRQNTDVLVDSVAITPKTLELEVGGTGSLSIAVLPANATSKQIDISSSDDSVATVSGEGTTVTALKVGTTTITAKAHDAGGKQDTCIVTVKAAAVLPASVTVTPPNPAVTVGGTVTLSPTVLPANATNKSVTYTSATPAVATVSASGVVTGVSAGTSVITVKTVSGDKTTTATVTVRVAVASVTLAPTTATVAVGATQQLTPTVLPANATNKAVTYSSATPAVATVNASGLVTGVSAGTAVITVTTTDGGKAATMTITVEAA